MDGVRQQLRLTVAAQTDEKTCKMAHQIYLIGFGHQRHPTVTVMLITTSTMRRCGGEEGRGGEGEVKGGQYKVYNPKRKEMKRSSATIRNSCGVNRPT